MRSKRFWAAITAALLLSVAAARYVSARPQTAPVPALFVGDEVQVGDIRWQVLSAQVLGREVKRVRGNGGSLFTDDLFVLVRFHLLNVGSDPVEFDGQSRTRKGVSLRDAQGREYPYYLVDRGRFRRDTPPEEIKASVLAHMK